MQRSQSIAAAIALACAAPVAFATAPSPEHPQTGMLTHTPPFTAPPHSSAAPTDTSLQPMPPRSPQSSPTSTTRQGQNDMSGTVMAVASNNVVEVKTDQGMLKVRFPHAHEQLKKGEKITVHLSYTVDPQPDASP